MVLQAIVLLLVIGGGLRSAGTLKTSKGSAAGLRVERVHHDGLCTFDLTAAEWAALALRLLPHTQRKHSLKYEEAE